MTFSFQEENAHHQNSNNRLEWKKGMNPSRVGGEGAGKQSNKREQTYIPFFALVLLFFLRLVRDNNPARPLVFFFVDVEDDDLLAAVVAAVCCSDSNINTVPLPSRITPCNRVLYVLLLFNLSIIHRPSSSSFT